MLVRLFCEIFYNSPILNHLTNLSSFFLNLLEAEQDGEEQNTGANVEEKKQKMGEVREAILFQVDSNL